MKIIKRFKDGCDNANIKLNILILVKIMYPLGGRLAKCNYSSEQHVTIKSKQWSLLCTLTDYSFPKLKLHGLEKFVQKDLIRRLLAETSTFFLK